MARYEIKIDERTEVPSRDAYAITLRVQRDQTDLGLWQTWVSGVSDVEIDRHSQPSITKAQRRRIAAELLADAIEDEARQGLLRDAWQLEVTVCPATTAMQIIEFATKSVRPVPDFQAGDTIRRFELKP